LPEQLGPVWLQFLLVLLLVSFSRYWIHRFQHANEFLWKLHSYHHQVQDLQATNTYVSHPIDFALRNVVIFLVLGIIGFDPLVLLVAVPLSNISGTFSHCGADLKAGLLNYVLVTPEVHRWHHTARVPDGYKYSCNYGVEFSFWDVLFGTFRMPAGALPKSYGVDEAGFPQEFVAQLVHPFRPLVAPVSAPHEPTSSPPPP